MGSSMTIKLNAEESQVTGEAEFFAARATAKAITQWLKNLEKKPKSIGIFQINVNPPLNKEFSKILEVEIIKPIRKENITKVVTCPKCQTPLLTVQDDRVIITKGSPDLESLKALSKYYNVNTFMTLEVHRTKLSLLTMVTLFQAGSGEIVATESFRVPALNFRGAATQIMLQGGTGVPFGGEKDVDSSNEGSSYVVNLALLEELDFGKGGLVLGAAHGKKSTLFYVIPTLGWRGTFENLSLQSLKSIGIGFGSSTGTQGIAVRASYNVFFGSFVGVGLEASYMIPFAEEKPKSRDKLSGFVGAHLIFTLGR